LIYYANPLKEEKEMSKIEDSVCDLIQSRAAFGLSKYKTSLEDAPLSLLEVLQHLQEELLDAASYIQKIKSILTTSAASIEEEEEQLLKSTKEEGPRKCHRAASE
jgi:hypothetical protein